MRDNEINASVACLAEGTLLQGGRYRITRLIGMGGFGCTYEAIQTGLDERVAVKEFFVKDFCNRDGATARVTVGTEGKRALVDKLRGKFVAEARALSRMRHPGIVRVRDVFSENGTAYYVMDYIEGGSLGDLIRSRGHLGEAEALRYIRQVCEALRYVHDRKCLHLDIKPGNIMIDSGGNAVLIDFGTSKQYDEEKGENTSTLMGKTPGYAPLEQIGNNVATFHPSTDIYALGATLYKALTGITPPASNMLASGEEELKPLPSGVSPSTRAAVAAAMELSGRKRPQTVAAFLAVLDAQAGKDEATEMDVADGVTPPEAAVISSGAPQSEAGTRKEGHGRRNMALLAGVAIMIALLAYGILSISGGQSAAPGKTGRAGAANAINGHEYVDLGLSVRWATCNIGANSPEEYGNHYAWGETKTKSSYDEDNCETWEEDIDDIGGTSRDVAHVRWGSSWRMPTVKEFDELLDNCDWKWTTLDGVSGCRVTGKNGNSIFLPAAGYRSWTSLYGAGENGYYWGSTPRGSGTQTACYLNFGSGSRHAYWYSRYYGFSVRPVSEF